LVVPTVSVRVARASTLLTVDLFTAPMVTHSSSNRSIILILRNNSRRTWSVVQEMQEKEE